MDLFRLPLPFVTLSLMALLAVRLARADGVERVARTLFLLLAALSILRSGLVGLRFGYGVETLIPLQRMLPLTLGPLTYLCFYRLTDRGFPVARAALRHGALALALILVCLTVPQGILWVDFVMLFSLGGYGYALWQLYRVGPDGWPGLGFGSADLVRLGLRLMLLVFAGEALLDSSIALDFLLAEGRHAPALIAVGNVFVILALAWALLHRPNPPARANPPPDEENRQARLLDDLDRLLADPAFYGDPDLTLARLAKRLHVPARRISEAINQRHGINVSHYVNRIRVLVAADMLRNTDRPIAEIMTACGFRSKSNFNRECHRVLGGSPSAVRAGTEASNCG